MGARFSDIPGITTNFSQPIKDNVDEALAGVKGELAIKLYGRDVFELERIARQITDVLRDIRGVTDLDYDHLVGHPQLQIVVDRKAATRYGINIQNIQNAIEAATRGRVVSQYSRASSDSQWYRGPRLKSSNRSPVGPCDTRTR